MESHVLKRLFRPEFLNRVDDIVVFQKLTGDALTKIAELLVDDLRQRLIANGMNIRLTDAAIAKIVAEGTDLTNGARPLRRAIQRLIEDPLSEELLAGEWSAGDTVLTDVVDDVFVFSHGKGEIPAPRQAGALGASFESAPRSSGSAPLASVGGRAASRRPAPGRTERLRAADDLIRLAGPIAFPAVRARIFCLQPCPDPSRDPAPSRPAVPLHPVPRPSFCLRPVSFHPIDVQNRRL